MALLVPTLVIDTPTCEGLPVGAALAETTLDTAGLPPTPSPVWQKYKVCVCQLSTRIDVPFVIGWPPAHLSSLHA